jgi:GNAT superfamily N-acetyltransferase
MDILNSTITDIDEIFRLYKLATDCQKTKLSIYWPEFERTMIEKDILAKEQWKIIIDQQVACIWSTTFDDPFIWGERNLVPSLYIHRIAANPEFRGRNFVAAIVEWARTFAKEYNKDFIRLDTVGDNLGLRNHFGKCGFDFLGLSRIKDNIDLPAHYHSATVSLYQMSVK